MTRTDVRLGGRCATAQRVAVAVLPVVIVEEGSGGTSLQILQTWVVEPVASALRPLRVPVPPARPYPD